MDKDRPYTPFYLSYVKPDDAELADDNEKPFQCLRFMFKKGTEYEDVGGNMFILHKRDGYDMPICAELDEKDPHICFPYFDKKSEQIHRIAVAGKSGSGKSFTIGLVLDQLIQNKPKPYEEDTDEFIDNPTCGRIVIFSSIPKDDSLDRVRRRYISIRPDIDSPDLFKMKPKDFKDCIVVFDDTERILNKKVNKFLLDLRANMMEVSRHYNTDLITVSHNILGGHVNNTVKNEFTSLFLFPGYNQKHTSDEFLKKYGGFSKAQIASKIMKHKESRWVFVSTLAPNYVVWDKGIEILY